MKKRGISNFDFDNERHLLPKSKLSQTTIFILLSILILSVAGLFFLYTNPWKDDVSTMSFNEQTGKINNGLRNCFEKKYEEAINDVSSQGGYFHEPLSMYLQNDLYPLPFYYFGELEYIPDKKLIEEEIAFSFDSKKESCFKIIEPFSIDFDYSYRMPNVTIKENRIEFTNNLRLVLTKENSTNAIDFDDEKSVINSNLFSINNLASYIAFSYSMNEESICLTCIQEIAVKKSLVVEIDDSIEGILIITISETKKGVYPRVYNFALTNIKTSPDLNRPYVNLTHFNYNKSLVPELNFNVSDFKNE